MLGSLGNVVADFENFHFKFVIFEIIDFLDQVWSDFGSRRGRAHSGSLRSEELSWNPPRNPRPQKIIFEEKNVRSNSGLKMSS